MKTPQEAAKELVQEFADIVEDWERAKSCARLAIQLLIDESNRTEKPISFWREAKTSIETL